MKCLTITIDDKVLFSGEVAEFRWEETAEIVSVAGRFRPQQSQSNALIEQIKNAAQQRRPGGSGGMMPGGSGGDANASPDSPRPTLDVVRDDE